MDHEKQQDPAPAAPDPFEEAMREKLRRIAAEPLTARNLQKLQATALLCKELLAVDKSPAAMNRRGKLGGIGTMTPILQGNYTPQYSLTEDDFDSGITDNAQGGLVFGPGQRSETFASSFIREALAGLKEFLAVMAPKPRKASMLDTVLAIEHAEKLNMPDVVEELKASLQREETQDPVAGPTKVNLFFEELSRRGVLPNNASEEDVKDAMASGLMKGEAMMLPYRGPNGEKPSTPEEAASMFDAERGVRRGAAQIDSSSTETDDSGQVVGFKIEGKLVKCASEPMTQAFDTEVVADDEQDALVLRMRPKQGCKCGVCEAAPEKASTFACVHDEPSSIVAIPTNEPQTRPTHVWSDGVPGYDENGRLLDPTYKGT
jgi:hypothetical protein